MHLFFLETKVIQITLLHKAQRVGSYRILRKEKRYRPWFQVTNNVGKKNTNNHKLRSSEHTISYSITNVFPRLEPNRLCTYIRLLKSSDGHLSMGSPTSSAYLCHSAPWIKGTFKAGVCQHPTGSWRIQITEDMSPPTWRL